MNPTTDPRFSRPRPVRCFVATIVIAGGLVGTAMAHEVGDTVTIDTPVRDDLYAAGRLVTVRSDIDGDLTVAGQSVSVLGMVTGDVMATGETVMLAGPMHDDVRVAGRTVMLSGEIGDHVIAAGEAVMVAKSARVGSFAWLAGRRVEIDGEITGDLDVAGETVVISGIVGGSVRADTTTLVIEASARIGGDVSWPAGQVPSISDDARIGGRRFERPGEPSPMRRPGAWFAGIVFNTVTLLILTGALGWVLRPLMRGATAIVHLRPGRAVGVGLLALIAAPLTAVVALVTVVGAPVGIAVLLGYALLLIFSVPTALASAAEYALNRRGGWGAAPAGWRLGALALVCLLFVLLLEVPVVRLLVGLTAVLVGLGALVLRLRGKPATGAATPAMT